MVQLSNRAAGATTLWRCCHEAAGFGGTNQRRPCRPWKSLVRYVARRRNHCPGAVARRRLSCPPARWLLSNEGVNGWLVVRQVCCPPLRPRKRLNPNRRKPVAVWVVNASGASAVRQRFGLTHWAVHAIVVFVVFASASGGLLQRAPAFTQGPCCQTSLSVCRWSPSAPWRCPEQVTRRSPAEGNNVRLALRTRCSCRQRVGEARRINAGEATTMPVHAGSGCVQRPGMLPVLAGRRCHRRSGARP